MADNLNSTSAVDGAMPVMKMEPLRFKRVNHFEVTAQLTIVIARHDNHLATIGEVAQKRSSLARRGFVVNEIAENDEPLRFVFVNQIRQSIRNRRHPPQWDESAGRALAQFITKMEIRDGEPPFSLMKKRKPAIEKNFVGDERLVRA